MSSGARLSIVCVSDLLVQIESPRLLYATDRPAHVCCSFAKRHVTSFQKRFLKFADFLRNHNGIYFSGKYHTTLVRVKMIQPDISESISLGVMRDIFAFFRKKQKNRQKTLC